MRLTLGRHVLDLYWSGLTELDDEDSILTVYYAHSSAAVRKQLATSVGMDIHSGGISEAVVERVREWWEWRVAVVLAQSDTANGLKARDELLDVVGPLANSRRFPDQWSLDQFLVVLKASGMADINQNRIL